MEMESNKESEREQHIPCIKQRKKRIFLSLLLLDTSWELLRTLVHHWNGNKTTHSLCLCLCRFVCVRATRTIHLSQKSKMYRIEIEFHPSRSRVHLGIIGTAADIVRWLLLSCVSARARRCVSCTVCVLPKTRQPKWPRALHSVSFLFTFFVSLPFRWIIINCVRSRNRDTHTRNWRSNIPNVSDTLSFVLSSVVVAFSRVNKRRARERGRTSEVVEEENKMVVGMHVRHVIRVLLRP